MKNNNSNLRVSNLTYVRLMSSLIEDVATFTPEEAMAIIASVNAYLHSQEPLTTDGKHSELLQKYRDLIDRAAIRSARARQAALLRKRKNVETPTQAVPTKTANPVLPQKHNQSHTPTTGHQRIKIKHRPARASKHFKNSKVKLR
ncbi:MAG: hypothetical protein K2H87_04195 [Duncaniella sp.]|nr:hypothetical protein [Duncaniella sp.]